MSVHLPRIGMLSIMQELYDKTLPDITDRQHEFAKQVAAQLADVAEVIAARPARNRDDIERTAREFENQDLDGVLVVNVTYGPSIRATRALTQLRLPIALANIQPDNVVTPAWSMADMTYNQGIHGAQDTANAMVRAGTPFEVITDEWNSESFKRRFDIWARSARSITSLRKLKIGIFGYPMTGMGDARVDEPSLVRNIGPEVHYLAPGELYRRTLEVERSAIDELRAWEDEHFDIDPRLSDIERDDHARLQIAIDNQLTEKGIKAYSTHFDAIGEDGRFSRLPMAAASTLMATKGYGFAGEGDILATTVVYAGQQLTGVGHFTEMYAMDFATDSILMSHMGEGNWQVHRSDEKPKLIKRFLGIGDLDDPPTVLFRIQPGQATLASLVYLGGDRFRLVVSEGEILDSQKLPVLEMPYGQFKPTSGVRACMDAWLENGGTHHMVMNMGHVAHEWRVVAKLAGIEYAEV